MVLQSLGDGGHFNGIGRGLRMARPSFAVVYGGEGWSPRALATEDPGNGIDHGLRMAWPVDEDPHYSSSRILVAGVADPGFSFFQSGLKTPGSATPATVLLKRLRPTGTHRGAARWRPGSGRGRNRWRRAGIRRGGGVPALSACRPGRILAGGWLRIQREQSAYRPARPGPSGAGVWSAGWLSPCGGSGIVAGASASLSWPACRRRPIRWVGAISAFERGVAKVAGSRMAGAGEHAQLALEALKPRGAGLANRLSSC